MERMKKFREKLAEKAGFTLVELIVVIAILGILAAVAVPTYTGYIARARETSDLQYLGSVATAVTGVAAGKGYQLKSGDTITVAVDGSVTIRLNNGNGALTISDSDVQLLVTGGTTEWTALKSDRWKANGATYQYNSGVSAFEWVPTTSGG